ncbi:hypothetical protein Glove_261g51 [Diversispora epigaea]|uniref:Uncharacterized protein n=1 Tax=Diversispora epigaea TaxID=1348612 RepID=A0A397I8P4_9GLOM|nr:hypothetical protein Glove_261g51 [Diversispora epigaea]
MDFHQIYRTHKTCNSSISGTNLNKIYQYIIEYGMDPEEFSIITEAEKNRWTMGCFHRDMLIGEELLYRGILKRDKTRGSTEISVLPEKVSLKIQINVPNKSRLPISILSNNPEEKMINTTLEQFNNLSFKHSNKYDDLFKT